MHHEKLPSAQKRYQDEVRRVLGVLEGVLTRDEWLVGEKISVADLAFVPCVHSRLLYSRRADKGLLGGIIC